MQEINQSEKQKLLQLQKEHESNSTKLDWMYGNPKHVESEEYLLGRAVDAGKNHVEHECIPPSIRDFKANPAEEQVDLAKKLQEDPLMEIQRRQLEARKKMLQNPIKLKQMQQMLKGHKIQQSNDDSSTSEDEDLNKKLLEKFMKLKSLKKKHKKKKKKKSETDDSSDDEKRKKDKKVSRSKRDESKNKKKRRSSDESESDRDHKKKRKDSKHREKRKRSDSSDVSAKRTSHSQERELQYEKFRNPSVSNKNYGLVTASGDKIHLKKSEVRHSREVAPKRKLDEKKWVKPERSRLSQEEKERRMREMMENAQWKEKTRPKTKSHREEEKELIKNYKEDPAFLKKYLLKHNDLSSVESRIKSNINNIQRGKGSMDSNFARR